MSATSGSTGVMPRSADHATRFGSPPDRAASTKDGDDLGTDNGSAGWSPLIASNKSATSATLRAIGPFVASVESIGKCCEATRPTLGRRPTTPQKLAGLRSDPPMSEPCASHAIPVASATAAPPDEPAADCEVFHGFRVAPNTSLKVFAPAPNSGVFDFA